MRRALPLLLLAACGSLAAQDGPVIRTTGVGEAVLAPDWAIVTLTVTSRADAAAEASRTNGRVVRAVWDAVARAGVPRDSVRTLSSGVRPVIDYRDEQRVVGYLATTSLRVPVRDLARLGDVIDAGLAAGATEVPGIQPRSTRADAVRAEVLAQAVAAARADAEALAAAAGGRLAGLVELATGEGGPPQPMMEMRALRAREPGPALDDLVIRVAVQAVWRFRPVRR